MFHAGESRYSRILFQQTLRNFSRREPHHEDTRGLVGFCIDLRSTTIPCQFAKLQASWHLR